MNSGTRMLFFVSVVSLVLGCKEPNGPKRKQAKSADELIEAFMEAVGAKIDREKVASIIYFSACQSPKGAYTTEVHSDTTGYTYFKQVYGFNNDSFLQVIHNKGRRVSLQDQPVSPETVYTLRSHEFMSILLELDKRFTDFRFPDTSGTGNGNGFQLLAKDELGHDSRLLFDSTTWLLKEIRFQNPDNASDMITTSFSSWKKVNGLNFPWHIVFTQGGNAYTFDIKTIKINDPFFKQVK